MKARLFLPLFIIFSVFARDVRAEVAFEEESVSSSENLASRISSEEEESLQRHNPFYFAYGRPLSKLQASFKTPLIKDFPLYFAYTQFMFWALHEHSRPFRDFTYNPEVFYRWRMAPLGLLESVDLGLWSHMSNGKAAMESRSYDKHYLRFNFEREARRWLTRFSLEVAYLHRFDRANREIQDYVGPLTMEMTFIQLFDSWVDKSQITLHASPGGKFGHQWYHGGYQISWSFRFGGLKLVPAFYLQYYFGYAETLLNYDERVSEFRGGLIF